MESETIVVLARLIEIHPVGLVQNDDFVFRIYGLASRGHLVIVLSKIDACPVNRGGSQRLSG